MTSVLDLIEPGVLRDKAGEYLQRAGEVLQAGGGVRLVDLDMLRVKAQVEDGEAGTSPSLPPRQTACRSAATAAGAARDDSARIRSRPR